MNFNEEWYNLQWRGKQNAELATWIVVKSRKEVK